ncbi:MAG: GHMP kinase [Candidatus Nezhaarchaeota archaeon]|nr:GHMP kinase [Candidatus Nezhaarchaeota archaeon]
MRVEVKAPARLHLGFITPAALEGRSYGSVGIAIEEPATLVRAERAGELRVEGFRAEDAKRFAVDILRRLNLPGARLIVERAPPPHIGLGSTTQLALTVAYAIGKVYGASIDPVEAAKVLGRGSRSGAGVYAFKYGGLVVDAGRGEGTEFPPLIFRCDFPSSWLFVAATPKGVGLSGRAEAEAFEALRSRPEVAYRAAYVALMKLIPAVLEEDFERFSLALTEFQTLVGEAFSEVQGGVFAEYSFKAIEALRALGIKGVGQSSWGPTVYGLVKAREAEEKLEEARRALPGCEVFLAKPSNRGASYQVLISD